MMNASNEFSSQNAKLTAHYMSRPRLNALFDQASEDKVVYVVAGTGYGKTQAVRHYVEQQEEAIVRWIQLTENDNIGSRFWESVTYAVAMDNPDLAAKLREFGFPETLSRFRQFVEIIKAAEHRACNIFFVLDDFHLAHSKETCTFLERCAHLQSPGIYVIYISRKEPEVSMAFLLSKGKLSMITEEDLRFTDTEAAEFFRQCKVPVSAQDLSRIVEATKGWALAINMFSLLLKRTPTHVEYVLDALRKNIFQLMESEAWDGLPAYVRKTMVKLSLVSKLSIMPLQELAGDTEFLQNAPELASFMWADSFTKDFRIHPLYLEFLQSKHDILSEAEKQQTYQRAAQWCSENDFYMDAIYYYAKSRQFARIIQTFLSYPFKLPRDTSEYFLDILEQLEPDKEEPIDPNMLFLKHYFTPLLLIGVGRYEEAQERSLAVIRKWEHADTPVSMRLLYATYCNLAYINMYTCTLSHRYHAPTYVKKSAEYFKRYATPAAAVSGAFINADIRSFACLVGVGARLPELDHFLEAVRQVEMYIAETPHKVYAGYAELVACEYAFFKNQPALARNHAHHAIAQAREKKQNSIVALAENYLLRIAMQEGDVPLVKEMLKQLRTHLDNLDFWNRQLYFDLYTGGFYAHLGLPELVPKWFAMDETETAAGIRIPARELYVSALYYIASKKYQQALTILCTSYPREPQEQLLFGELRLSLLTALARIRTGDTVGAMADFEQAYALSFHGVFELFFIELGKELHPLIVAALKQTDCVIPKEWLNTIDRKASIYAKKTAIIANAFQDKTSCKESVSLSDREREVLLDLYHGLSREEIAANRYLSINTVKKTLQSIYIKLDAHNNVDAIRIALEQKLVE